MSEQQVLSANLAALDSKRFPEEPSIILPASFNIGSVDGALAQHCTIPAVPPIHDDETPPPAPLSFFQGKYGGPGFNTIFRPSGPINREHAATNPALASKFENPINPGRFPDDNILELNLTREAWSFGTALGQVPNRGTEGQDDVVILGVPYTQSVRDVTNTQNGTGDASPGRPIHFEPGLFLHVPLIDKPASVPTISRLASIPHGTTINVTGIAPSPDVEIPGAPDIFEANIIPNITNSSQRIFFPSLTFTTPDSARLPQDLTQFAQTGAISTDIFTDPNTVLRNFNALLGDRIVSNTTFELATTSATDPSTASAPGSVVPKENTHLPGLANISFLDEPRTDVIGGPNADATRMKSTFWISKVRYTLAIPPLRNGECREILPLDVLPGASGPVFKVTADREIVEGGEVEVFARHIQYSQNVNLVFRGLDWPHISCASLLPLDPVKVGSEELAGLV